MHLSYTRYSFRRRKTDSFGVYRPEINRTNRKAASSVKAPMKRRFEDGYYGTSETSRPSNWFVSPYSATHWFERDETGSRKNAPIHLGLIAQRVASVRHRSKYRFVQRNLCADGLPCRSGRAKPGIGRAPTSTHYRFICTGSRKLLSVRSSV
jgi:hypothetical protein